MRQFLSPSPLLTDLYQLTMLQGYLEHGFKEKADFEFFVRDLPVNRNFLLAAGLEEVIDFLTNMKFSEKELDWLSKQRRFSKDFISYLEYFNFEGSVFAMPEGTVFFPGEPILRVSAPIPQAQLVETRIINLLHYQTMIASKAVRSVIAAKDNILVDFGLRRAHGAEAGLFAARSSYLAGFSGTSTVLAGELYDIPLFGTMAHSFIQAHDDEMTAFENFTESHPDNIILLVDTYDIFKAIAKVVKLSRKLRKKNIKIQAVRLDSGDLVNHSQKIRKILDKADLQDIKIFASGNLDEYALQKFTAAHAPIDGYGVGTLMVTSSDAPYLECGYKLVQFAGQARYKKSPKKETWPCPKQVYRYIDNNGKFSYDEITLDSEERDAIPLLDLVLKNGKRIKVEKPVSEIRDYAKTQIDQLPAELLNLNKKSDYSVKISNGFKKYTSNRIFEIGILLAVLLTMPINNLAQSPYEMNWKRDGALIVIGLPIAAFGIALDRSIDPLTPEQLNKLDRNQINKFDRFVSYHYSESAAGLSDILLYACIASPLLFLTSSTISNDIGVISGMYLESLILGVATPAWAKGGFQRIRPYTYNPDVPIEKKLTAESKRSFFSGHTTMAFTSTIFLSTIYSTYYPNSKAKTFIWTGSLLLASTVGYLRIAAGSHFLTDVLVGAVVGTAIGYIIPKIHETDYPESMLQAPGVPARQPMLSVGFAL